MLILAPIAAMLIQMAISRSREFAADAGAAQIIGSPHPLVNALRKIDAIARRVPLDANPATAHMFIVQPFTGASLASLFATHPPMDKRIAALLGSSLTPRGPTQPNRQSLARRQQVSSNWRVAGKPASPPGPVPGKSHVSNDFE